jgi:hypothetical protein
VDDLDGVDAAVDPVPVIDHEGRLRGVIAR